MAGVYNMPELATVPRDPQNPQPTGSRQDADQERRIAPNGEAYEFPTFVRMYGNHIWNNAPPVGGFSPSPLCPPASGHSGQCKCIVLDNERDYERHDSHQAFVFDECLWSMPEDDLNPLSSNGFASQEKVYELG
eukprot:gene25895-43717_t